MGRRKPQQARSKGKPEADEDVGHLCSNLVDLCSQQLPESTAQLWIHYELIHDVLSKIMHMQGDEHLEFSNSENGNRSEKLPEFVAWCESMRVERFGVEVAEFPGFGFGLIATKDLEAEKVILHVPRRSMITSELAERSELKEAVKNDPVLKGMSNVTLAMFVLSEKIKGADSDWKHYIDILPSEYNTVLYFEKQDFELIRHSRAFELAITMYRSIARQYGYFYQLIANPASYFAKSVLDSESFTFEAYRWAVSAVTTRLNMIPCDDGSSWAPQIPALIPFWDMANHTEGAISTDYDSNGRRGVCFAIRNYSVGEQVCIFYGHRNNAQFVVHNGFFFDGNSSDSTPIRLGLARSDKLYSVRLACLDKYGLSAVDSYDVYAETPYFAKSMLSFARVFNATEQEMGRMLADGDKTQTATAEHLEATSIETTNSLIKPVSQENEIKVWTFLKNRLLIILRSYPKSKTEYFEELKNELLSRSQVLVIKLLISEMSMLERAMQYADRMAGEMQKI